MKRWILPPLLLLLRSWMYWLLAHIVAYRLANVDKKRLGVLPPEGGTSVCRRMILILLRGNPFTTIVVGLEPLLLLTIEFGICSSPWIRPCKLNLGFACDWIWDLQISVDTTIQVEFGICISLEMHSYKLTYAANQRTRLLPWTISPIEEVGSHAGKQPISTTSS